MINEQKKNHTVDGQNSVQTAVLINESSDFTYRNYHSIYAGWQPECMRKCNRWDPKTKSRGSKYSRYSICTLASFFAVFSFCSMFSANSFMGIFTVNSILSIGTTNSVLSIGSINSVLSIGCVNSMMCMFGATVLDPYYCAYKDSSCSPCPNDAPFCSEDPCKDACAMGFIIQRNGSASSYYPYNVIPKQCACGKSQYYAGNETFRTKTIDSQEASYKSSLTANQFRVWYEKPAAGNTSTTTCEIVYDCKRGS